MFKERVTIPVLVGIGCGVFRGLCPDVPTLWAEALCDVLLDNNNEKWVKQFEYIFLCQARFNSDSVSIYEQFYDTVAKHQSKLPVPVALVSQKMPYFLANSLAQQYKEHRVGLLNPSDAHAVRQGYLGMYWDGGDIAMEEILAWETTLLLQSCDLNPALYDVQHQDNMGRYIPVSIHQHIPVSISPTRSNSRPMRRLGILSDPWFTLR